jgi:diaminopropionate ammonia-lyase
VLVKHEAERFGLPAFKIVGASWAIHRVLTRRLGSEPDFDHIDELRDAFAPLRPLTFVTATDGNHGRAVARAARWFGMDAHIYVPSDTAAARIDAIASEGATVTVVAGDYDAAVATAAATAGDERLVISDTSWPGYAEVPAWIAEGYSTIFLELDDQLSELGLDPHTDVSAVLIPVGVGALAVAALSHWPDGPPLGPSRIAVEPAAADCLRRSLDAGEPVTVPGPHHSMMAGLNCGTVSMIAWPTMRDGFEWSVAIDDDDAAEAMRALADDGLVAGETGAATVGALIALCEAKSRVDAPPVDREAMRLGPHDTVVCLVTEGATDPEKYLEVVGREASHVHTRGMR